MKKRIVLSALSTAIALSLLAGCSEPGVTGGSSTEPVEGGTLVYGEVSVSEGRWSTSSGGAYQIGNVLNSLVDRLTFFNPETKELEPWLASEFSSNEDATEFTFVLREDVTFSDGTPLDPEVVKANLDRLGLGIAELELTPNLYYTGYESAEILDEKTVRVSFSRPNSHFLYATSAVHSGIVGLSTLEKNASEQAQADALVGSGPFVFGDETPGEEIILLRRDDYAWPPASSPNQGAAHLESVIVRAIPEVGNRAGALQSDQVGLVRGILPTDEAIVSSAGYAVHAIRPPDLIANVAIFHPENEIVSDRNVRYALAIGFDRQTLVRTVLGENYDTATSILNSGTTGIVDVASDIAYDPEEAARLLDAAGWVLGEDGIREKDGVAFHIEVGGDANNASLKPAWEFIAEQWRDLGVRLDVRVGDATFASEARTSSDVALFSSRTWRYGGFGQVFFGGGYLTLIHEDAELEALFAEERESTDESVRLQSLAEQQRQLVSEKVYVVPIFEEVQVYGGSPGLHIAFTAGTAPIFQSAWLDSGKSSE